MSRTTVCLCSCGGIIGDKVDLLRVAAELQLDPAVDRIIDIEFLCSEEGKQEVAEALGAEPTERVVFAACSPRDHAGTCREIMRAVGVNPWLHQMANVRELVAWVVEDREVATAKAVTTIRAAIARVAEHSPLEARQIESS